MYHNEINSDFKNEHLTKPNFHENLDRKLFIGGLSNDTNEEDLIDFFTQFGKVENAKIKYDSITKKPRGFGFITMSSENAIDKILNFGPLDLKGKKIDPKRAKSRPVCKKVFVGGISIDVSKEDIKNYFSKFGVVEEIELAYDRFKSKRREFCFVIFDSEKSADCACVKAKQFIGGKECDVKKSQPQLIAQQQKKMQSLNYNQNYMNGNHYNRYKKGSNRNHQIKNNFENQIYQSFSQFPLFQPHKQKVSKLQTVFEINNSQPYINNGFYPNQIPINQPIFEHILHQPNYFGYNQLSYDYYQFQAFPNYTNFHNYDYFFNKYHNIYNNNYPKDQNFLNNGIINNDVLTY